MDRKKWKDEFAQKRYGQSYVSLCSERKRIVDQTWILIEMERSEKLNKKGCR
jgi:hypothetical protein